MVKIPHILHREWRLWHRIDVVVDHNRIVKTLGDTCKISSKFKIARFGLGINIRL